MNIIGIDPSIRGTAFTVMKLDEKYDLVDYKMYAMCKTKKWCINTEKVNVLCTTTSYDKYTIYEKEDIANEFITQNTADVEYCAIEDFSYSMDQITNSMYQIGEFVGTIRKTLYDRNIKIDRYSPKSIKRFATGSDAASKYLMMVAFKQKHKDLFPIEIETDLKLNDIPQTDLVDSFWICEILRNKLKLLNGYEIDEGIKGLLMYKSLKKSHSLMEIQPEYKNS